MESIMKVQTANTGEEEAFMQMVLGQQRLLYGIAYSYLRSEADALEVLQEATCRAWTKRRSLKDPARFTPWLIRIVINCCNDELKRRKRVLTVKPAEPDNNMMEMRSDLRLDMEQALDGMKPKYRQVLVLKYYRDMTVAEIAEILDRPVGTVKTWLNKGLKHLRGKMKIKEEA
ncbi:RNA polymerase sigma factor [Paenibacillus agri]|uniref:Sigma-70 family RNA polymerase sigma factor n=1 Tax=Paenibacillus agri TaxID=2744309 RepID=A0A850F2C0_9BACL|nr:sigma-70 family RNA polymerase sigma factor [Paenibacillus agri]NUU64181.1 sigma-70 family RNA polymerase sigma factor [Paenibacillus agri]